MDAGLPLYLLADNHYVFFNMTHSWTAHKETVSIAVRVRATAANHASKLVTNTLTTSHISSLQQNVACPWSRNGRGDPDGWQSALKITAKVQQCIIEYHLGRQCGRGKLLRPRIELTAFSLKDEDVTNFTKELSSLARAVIPQASQGTPFYNTIIKYGIEPVTDKGCGTVDMPTPKSKADVRRFTCSRFRSWPSFSPR